MSDEIEYGPGVKKYIEEAKKFIAQREKNLERVKKLKFDTIAVHGLYTVEEALVQNQGAVIEPLYLSTAQAYRDADEMEAALAYLIPTWCYTRFANPTTSYLEWTLALLEGYQTGYDTSCLVTASGMSAIMLAVDPFLVKQKEGQEQINFVSSIQIYGGTFQHFSVRKMKERGIEVRWVIHPEDTEEWKAKIDDNTRFLYAEAPSNPQQAFCDIKALADLAHS
ncbi:MAG: PLP-dependent transferase, partial [Candidatus Aminicenantes bacterium]|nr:PLP-dependent transferase [Candidatus Aminicenantes bacterium]